MRTAGLALLLPCLVLIAACGGEDGGRTIVVTTKGGSASAPATPLGIYRIPSGSMEPTLPLGDHVAVEEGSPRVDEIVVFHPPEGAAQEICGSRTPISPGGAACDQPVPRKESIKFIKRIVAGPGDTIRVIEGHVIRNGQREKDLYIRPCPGVSECNFPIPIKVPEGDWYLMGDNRGESDDSRFWELERSGLSYQRIPPDYRFPYGHTHKEQEELFVVVGGSGRMKLDEEIVEVKKWDVVRVAPGTWRGYEAGPEGLEILVFGAPNLGENPREDVEGRRDWWAD